MENKLNKTIKIIIAIVVILSPFSAFSQADSRYDTGLNLPFNEKAGDVNPQTGNISINAADVSLPGRGGKNFSFGRIWSLNQANVFNMYADPTDGSNRLNSNTVEKYNNLGVGWNSSIPYIYEDDTPSRQISPLLLFFGGSVYELDRNFVTGETNILYYDLENMRVERDGSVSYGDFDLYDISALENVADTATDNNHYVLLLKDNSKYFFREDGKLLMEQDKTGRNQIWYFYNSDGNLSLVVDTIGRQIKFTYDSNDNIESISWDITKGIKTGETRERVTETRTVYYTYLSAENFPEMINLANTITNYREPFLLTGFTDPQGNVTKYDYSAGNAPFSYNSLITHATNVYMLLTSVTSMYTPDGNYKAIRNFEYEVPEKGMYEKKFYDYGYMKYYKISGEYNVNRHGEIKNNTLYIYHGNGEAGNFNQYESIIEQGNVKTTYTYLISGDESRNNVLASMLVETKDEFNQLREFTYNTNRAKTYEKVQRMGRFIYDEKYEYDRKGNLRRHTDKMGLEIYREYDEKYSVPLLETKTLDANTTYRTRAEINEYGQVIKQILYLGNRAVDVATITYDPVYGNPIAQTDADGNTIHTVYDEESNAYPVKIWQEVSIDSWNGSIDVNANWQNPPDGKTKVRIRSWKVFNTDGTVWIEIDNEGFAIEHYYDSLGMEIETVIPDRNDLTGFANPVKVDENGNPLEVDFPDFLLHPVYIDGSFLNSRTNNPGLRMEVDYQNEFVKTFTDIEIDINTGIREVKVKGAQGDGLGNAEEEIEYDEYGDVYAVKKMQYDSYNRMVSLTDPDRGNDLPDFTIHGKTIDRYDSTWMIKYDDLGRQIRVYYPETRAGVTDIKYISYNDYENSATTIDPEKRQVYERMDWNGNLVEVAAGKEEDKKLVYKYDYDRLNRKVSFTDPKGIVTEYKYDIRNLLIEQFYGKGSGSDFMEYNDLGLLVKKTDRKDQVLTFTYDEIGRNTSVDHFTDELAVEPVRTIKTTYDNRGNPARVESESLIEHYVYDNENRVITLDRLLNNADPDLDAALLDIWEDYDTNKVFSFQYKYNAAGMVTEMVYPDGSVHAFTYDPAHARLMEIAEGEDELSVLPFVTGLEYNLAGVVTRMDYSNRTFQEWDFDNRKRISNIRITGPAEIIEELRYTLNGSGDILKINDNEYEYDEFDRIIGAKTKNPENVDYLKLVEEHFGTYQDPGVNNGIPYLTEADLNTDGRINGLDHHLASMENSGSVYDVESFEYDKNGNRTKLIQNGDTYTYTYGVRNQLVNISLKKRMSIQQPLLQSMSMMLMEIQ